MQNNTYNKYKIARFFPAERPNHFSKAVYFVNPSRSVRRLTETFRRGVIK